MRGALKPSARRARSMATKAWMVSARSGDRAVGLASLHRRAVRPRRRDHQDRRLAGRLDESLIGARRGVALHRFADAVGPSGACAAGSCSARARAKRSAVAPRAAKMAILEFGADRSASVERDVEPGSAERRLGSLRPLHEHDRLASDFFPAEFAQFAWPVDAIEVGVHQRTGQGFVGLHEGEGRARHLEIRILGQGPNDRPRQRRLAGPKAARQRDQIAGLQLLRQEPGKALGHADVGKGQLPFRDRLVRRRRSRKDVALTHVGERPYSAARRRGVPSIGKMQTTVVPAPGVETRSMRPPCNSTKDRTIDRPRPTPRWRVPSV